MIETESSLGCPICGENYLTGTPVALQNYDANRYDCMRCGTFDLDNFFRLGFDEEFDQVKHFVSAWIRQQNKAGITQKRA